jgi:predicted nucleotidyltransferase
MNLHQLHTINNQLSTLSSLHPFSVIHYGSRLRGDFNEYSDMNFFLVGDGRDQLRSSFIQDIVKILQAEFPFEIDLISGDKTTFLYRMELFDPVAVHVMEMGKPIFGQQLHFDLMEKWGEIKKNPINLNVLQTYIEKRIRFYKKLEPRNEEDNVNRLQKLIALTLQNWVLMTLDELSLIELVHMDIPHYLPKMIKVLYKTYSSPEIHNLASIYEDFQTLKRCKTVFNSKYVEEQIQRYQQSVEEDEPNLNDFENSIQSL